MVTSVAFGAHPTSDASQIGLNRAFARVDRPLGAVFSVFVRPESLNPGTTWTDWMVSYGTHYDYLISPYGPSSDATATVSACIADQFILLPKNWTGSGDGE